MRCLLRVATAGQFVAVQRHHVVPLATARCTASLRMMASRDVIDLTDDMPGSDQQQGHRSDGGKPQVVQAAKLGGQQQAVVTLDDSDEETATQQVPPPKRARSSAAAITAAATPSATAAAKLPEPAAYPMRDVLRAAAQEREARQRAAAQGSPLQAASPTARSKRRTVGQDAPTPRLAGPTTHTVTVLSYNLWFAPLAMEERMRGLAQLIKALKPDVLMFQEVTEDMLEIFALEHEWLVTDFTWSPPPPASYFTLLGWRTATLSQRMPLQRRPFSQTSMGRDVTSVALVPAVAPRAPPLLVATSHLESPMGRKGLYIESRIQQLSEGVDVLEARAEQLAALPPPPAPRKLEEGPASPPTKKSLSPDILWAGDMNWISQQKAEPVLPDSWVDVWRALRPGEIGGTYCSKENPMLRGNWPPGRLDRMFARLSSWKAADIQIVGKDQLMDEAGKPVEVQEDGGLTPVVISDHYGLLLKLEWLES